MRKNSFKYNRPLILAHRAVYPGYPENTLVSLEKIIDEGAHYAEVDVEFTVDKKMVCSHDQTVDRCTNGEGAIYELNFEYIRSLDAAHYLHSSKFKNIRIPTLEEILNLVKDTSLLLELHIKSLDVLDVDEYPTENVPELLLKYNMANRANINIDIVGVAEYLFEFEKYKDLRFTLNGFIDMEHSPEKQMDKLDVILKTINDAGFFGLDLTPAFISKKVSRFVHDYGFELQCYPVNDISEMRRLINAECDVIQTDNMDRLKDVLIEFGFN